MKVLTEFESFAQYVKLPDGFKFHEWTKDIPVILPVLFDPSKPQTYYDAGMMAIERISDGKFLPFEISNQKQELGRIFLSVAELAEAVDKALTELQA